MEKILIEFQQAINRTIPKLEVIKVFLIQWYKEDFLKFIFGLALMLWPLVENFQMFIALLYVIGGDLIQPVGLLLCVYLLTKLAGKSKKKETDPTNINAFDRCLALAGSFLPPIIKAISLLLAISCLHVISSILQTISGP